MERRVESVEALLVSTGSPRLRAVGFRVPDPVGDADLRLYELLARNGPDAAHSR